MPGDNVTANFELIHPVPMDPGLRFAIREGGRTVGAGAGGAHHVLCQTVCCEINAVLVGRLSTELGGSTYRACNRLRRLLQDCLAAFA